jgi:hypothetical protein
MHAAAAGWILGVRNIVDAFLSTATEYWPRCGGGFSRSLQDRRFILTS